jgi:hypothetical protein
MRFMAETFPFSGRFFFLSALLAIHLGSFDLTHTRRPPEIFLSKIVPEPSDENLNLFYRFSPI